MGTLIALTVEVDEDWKTVEMPDSPAVQAASPSHAEPRSPVTKAEPPPGQYDPLTH